jgi:hypothetical protein
MTVEERLGRIEEQLNMFIPLFMDELPAMKIDIESLKEFKWKIIGAIGVIVPIWTYVIVKIFGFS